MTARGWLRILAVAVTLATTIATGPADSAAPAYRPAGPVMTVEVGVITGDLEYEQRGSVLYVRYRGAAEWYRVDTSA